MTVRLYYQDPYLFRFTAKVLACRPVDDAFEVQLDRTCFYPESGGQPSDSGQLGGRQALGVREEGTRLLHRVDGPIEIPEAEGCVDSQRRLDHMEHHTGQHLLSAAFLEGVGIPTVSAHISAHESTIDLDRPELFEEDADKAEELANRVIRENRTIHCFYPTLDELKQLTFRKMPSVEEDIRVVRVPDFDVSACCGTHCPSTGRVGLVKVRRWEHYKGMTRLYFHCGRRALEEFRFQNSSIRDLSELFSVKDRDLVARVAAMHDEHVEAYRQLRKARSELLKHEAASMLSQSQRLSDGTLLVVRELAEGHGMEELKVLAEALLKHPGVVFLGGAAGPKAQVLFARSPDWPGDMSSILRKVVSGLGGKGGGAPHQAQGGVPGTALSEAIALARKEIETLSGG